MRRPIPVASIGCSRLARAWSTRLWMMRRPGCAGALYGVTPMEKSVARPIGEWNGAGVVVTREQIEHWLNGVKAALHPVDVPLPSPIVLQYHFTQVKFRNLRIRRLR